MPYNQYTRPWTEDELEVLKELYPLHPKNEVVYKINRSWSAIRTKAKKMGIKRFCNTKRVIVTSPSSDLAYVLGAHLGDGCSNRYSKRMELRVKDEEFADRFAETLRRMGFGVYRMSKDGVYYVFGISAMFYRWLENLDLDSLEDIVNAYPIDFLRGFFDAEGSFFAGRKTDRKTGQPHCTITNTREDLIELIKRTIVRLGFQVRKETRQRTMKSNWKNSYTLRILGGKEEINRFLQLIKPISQKQEVKYAN